MLLNDASAIMATVDSHKDIMITNFADIIGQGKAKEILKRSVSSEKMSHAYLFRGPAGVGKKTMAHTFAALINCLSPGQHDVCGKCIACMKFRSGSHPDFMRIEPEGAAIKIKQIRDLKHALTFPPYEAKYRVVLLVDVHTMRREAANSMLKTLEEPPENTILILTGDEANEILPTIISRCQVVPFFALPYNQVAETLAIEEEISNENAATLAAISEGSLGRARLLHQKELLQARQNIVDKLLSHSPDQPETVEVVLELAESTAKLKEDLNELLDLLKVWFRDLILHVSGAPDFVINRDLFPSFQTAAQRWNLQQLSDKLQLLSTAKKQLDRNCNKSLVCEVLFFGLL